MSRPSTDDKRSKFLTTSQGITTRKTATTLKHTNQPRTAGRYGDRPPLAATQDRSNTDPEGNRRTRPADSRSRQPDDRRIPDSDYEIRTPRWYLTDATQLRTHDWSRSRHC